MGAKYWYQDDKLHRLDGPAIELRSGTKEWYQDGKLHRLDGPAVERNEGPNEWWINGKHLTIEEVNKFISRTA